MSAGEKITVNKVVIISVASTQWELELFQSRTKQAIFFKNESQFVKHGSAEREGLYYMHSGHRST